MSCNCKSYLTSGINTDGHWPRLPTSGLTTLAFASLSRSLPESSTYRQYHARVEVNAFFFPHRACSLISFLARHRELVKLNELYTGLQGLDGPRDHGPFTSLIAPSEDWGPMQPCFSCCRFRSAHVFDYDQRQVRALHSTRHCVDCRVREGRYLAGILIFMYSLTTDAWYCGRYMFVCTGCGKLAKGKGCYRCGMCGECIRAALVTLRSSINKLSQELQSPWSCGHLRGLDLYKRTKDMTDRRDRYIREQKGPGMDIEEWVAYVHLYYDLPSASVDSCMFVPRRS